MDFYYLEFYALLRVIKQWPETLSPWESFGLSLVFKSSLFVEGICWTHYMELWMLLLLLTSMEVLRDNFSHQYAIHQLHNLPRFHPRHISMLLSKLNKQIWKGTCEERWSVEQHVAHYIFKSLWVYFSLIQSLEFFSPGKAKTLSALM